MIDSMNLMATVIQFVTTFGGGGQNNLVLFREKTHQGQTKSNYFDMIYVNVYTDFSEK